jgi:hypothetical protein
MYIYIFSNCHAHPPDTRPFPPKFLTPINVTSRPEQKREELTFFGTAALAWDMLCLRLCEREGKKKKKKIIIDR